MWASIGSFDFKAGMDFGPPAPTAHAGTISRRQSRLEAQEAVEREAEADLVAEAEAHEDEIRGFFARYDVNRDGSLQREELRSVLLDLDLPSGVDDVESVFQAYDADKDGRVTFEEFKLHYNDLMAASRADRASLAAIWAAERLQADAAAVEDTLWRADRDAAVAAAGRGAAAEGGAAEPGADLAAAVAHLMAGQATATELDQLSVRPSLRVFVSSTFLDTATQRNYLAAFCWRDLGALCSTLDLAFDVVDLRWGVTDATTDDHGTTDLCLGEIARCAEQSAGAAFLFLSGERYGWRALPKRCPVDEFETLLGLVARDTPAALPAVRLWYARDANAVPQVYELRNVGAVKADPATPAALCDFWAHQETIAGALRSAAVAAGLPQHRLDDWTLSVTHKEVRAGLRLKTGRCLVIRRTLEGLRSAARDGRDGPVNEYLAPVGDIPLLDSLRAEATAGVGPAESAAAALRWPRRRLGDPAPPGAAVSDAEVVAHTRGVAASAYALLARDCRSAAARHAALLALSDLDREAAAHAALAARRAAAFLSRRELLAAAAQLAVPGGAHSAPRVLWGRSGCGKTSLVAAAAHASGRLPPGTVTVVRFCGTSMDSTSARGLVRSLCQQLLVAYGRPATEVAAVPVKLKDLAPLFARLLAELPSVARPVRILIDCLDQLSDQEGGRSRLFEWLPAAVPPHAALLVSTLPDDDDHARGRGGTHGQLRDRLRHGATHPDSLEVGLVHASDASEVLTALLAASGRCLAPPQRRAIEASFATGATALQLKLLALEGSRLRSWDPIADLPTTVDGLISRFFDRLEAAHSAQLTARVLGLLAVCEAGLSQRNLLDLLSASEDVLGWEGKRGALLQYATPAVRRCPPLVFARLLDSMTDFLVERAGPGTTVLAFYHRVFRDAASRRYLPTASHRARLLGLLADLFSGALAARFPTRGIDHHRRPLSLALPVAQARDCPSQQALLELPAALLALGEVGIPGAARPEQLSDVLTNLDFVAAAAAVGRLSEMASAINSACAQLGRLLFGKGKREDLADTLHWLQLSAPQIAAMPELCYCEALNAPAGSAPERALQHLIKVGGLDLSGVWARVDKPGAYPVCLSVLDGHAHAVRGAVFSADGAVVTSACRATLRTWSTGTGELLQTTESPVGDASTVAVAPGGGSAASVSGKHVVVWSAESGKAVHKLSGHSNSVCQVAWSADGLFLVTASKDKSAKLWDATTGFLWRTFLGHRDAVWCCAFSGDNRAILTGSFDTTARVWSAATGDLDRVLEGHETAVTAVGISGDGDLIATGSWSTLRLWSASSGRLRSSSLKVAMPAIAAEIAAVRSKETSDHYTINCLAFSPTAGVVATGTRDCAIRLWSTATCEVLRSFEGSGAHTNWVLAVCFSPDGHTLASCSVDQTIRLWATAAAETLRLLEGSLRGNMSRASSTRGLPAGVAETDSPVKGPVLWSLAEQDEDDDPEAMVLSAPGEHTKAVSSHSAFTRCVSFSPDGATVASGSDDFTVRVWATAKGGLLLALEGHQGPVWRVCFSRDATMLASGSGDCTVKIWDAKTGELLRTLAGHRGEISCLAFSDDMKRIASGCVANAVRCWSVVAQPADTRIGSSGNLPPFNDAMMSCAGSESFTAPDESESGTLSPHATWADWAQGHMAPVTCVSFSADNHILASGSWDCSVRLWSSSMGVLLQMFKGHAGGVTRVVFSPDGSQVASNSAEEILYYWSTQQVDLVRTLEEAKNKGEIEGLCLSPDGLYIATASKDNSIRIWRATPDDGSQGGALYKTFKGHEDDCMCVCYGDNDTLASGSRDKTIRIWSVSGGKALHVLTGHADRVTGLAFTPDHAILVSGSEDKTVRTWTASTGTHLLTFKISSLLARSAFVGQRVGEVACVAVSSDGTRVASGAWDHTIRIWSISGELQLTMSGHKHLVKCVAFSANGQKVASGSKDKTARVWSTATGDQLLLLEGHLDIVHAVAFSPDSQQIATGSGDNTIKLWSLNTGRLLKTLHGHTKAIKGLAYFADGETLVSCGADESLRFWAVGSVKPLRTYEGVVTDSPFAYDALSISSGAHGATPDALRSHHLRAGHSTAWSRGTFSASNTATLRSPSCFWSERERWCFVSGGGLRGRLAFPPGLSPIYCHVVWGAPTKAAGRPTTGGSLQARLFVHFREGRVHAYTPWISTVDRASASQHGYSPAPSPGASSAPAEPRI